MKPASASYVQAGKALVQASQAVAEKERRMLTVHWWGLSQKSKLRVIR